MSATLPPNLYIVGMPASGKTTLGKKLSRLLHRPFLDTDAEVENATGLSVAAYFEQQGEAAFREREREVLLRTFLVGGYVVATGGGLAAYRDNMSLIIERGVAVYVDTPFSVLVARLQNQPDKRPLFATPNLTDTLREKFQERQRFYRQAQFVISPFEDLPAFVQRLRPWLPDVR